MSPEQKSQMNMSLAAEDKPLAASQMKSAGVETNHAALGTPLVPEEDLERMRTQIAGVFKDSPSLSGKNPEWKAETGMGEQVAKVALFGLKHPLLVGKGIREIFKSKKSRSRDSNIKSQGTTPQF